MVAQPLLECHYSLHGAFLERPLLEVCAVWSAAERWLCVQRIGGCLFGVSKHLSLIFSCTCCCGQSAALAGSLVVKTARLHAVLAPSRQRAHRAPHHIRVESFSGYAVNIAVMCR